MIEKPIVSFALRAYNQEKEIVRALRSVTEQRLSFCAEIVVSVDQSIDNTLAVVNNFMQSLPENFEGKVVYDGKRRGGVGNLCHVMHNCSGKYISWLDGDDYFIYPDKTQECVDLMEKDNTVGLVYTDLQIESEHRPQPVLKKSRPLGDNQFNDLLQRNCFGSCSTLFRSDLLKYIDWEVLLESPSFAADDYFCWLEFSLQTKFAYIPKCTSTYCVNRTISNTSAKDVVQYDKSTGDICRYYIRKYPNYTSLTEDLINQKHYHLQFETALRYRDAAMASDAVIHLPVPEKQNARLIFWLCKSNIGFNLYLLYRRIKRLSVDEDKYFYS